MPAIGAGKLSVAQGIFRKHQECNPSGRTAQKSSGGLLQTL